MLASDIDKRLLDDLQDRNHVEVFEMDVTNDLEVSQTALQISRLTEKIDILVSNAGIFDFFPISEAGSEKLGRIFAVNTLALPTLTKHFLPLLEGGRLIVISSESYKVPSPFQPYAVSKQALEAIYRAMKPELALMGIRCILIRPGAMKTQILEATLNYNVTPEGSRFRKAFDKFLSAVPKYIGRVVTPEVVARTVFKAGTVRNPRSIYHVNHNPLVSVLSALPARWQGLVVQKTLGNSKNE